LSIGRNETASQQMNKLAAVAAYILMQSMEWDRHFLEDYSNNGRGM
jgi:hypothetical protein